MPEKEMSLLAHLAELRKGLLRCVIPFLAALAVSFSFVKPLIHVLRLPARGIIDKLAFFSPQEVALSYIKAAVFSGLVLSFPFIILQVWKFISPAIESKQRRYVFIFVFSALACFLAGIGFAFFFLVPVSLKFLVGLGAGEFIPVISLGSYFSFVIALLLGCGIVFELPLAILVLNKAGIVSQRFLRQKRKYAIAGIFILAAVITPTTDPVNMCLLAVPMLALYEIGVLVVAISERNVKK